MKKRVPSVKKQMKAVWDKYEDTLWKIEQSWSDPKLTLSKKTLLTDSVLELIKIKKKLKSIETKYQSRVGDK